jgi:hypothetical protein
MNESGKQDSNPEAHSPNDSAEEGEISEDSVATNGSQLIQARQSPGSQKAEETDVAPDLSDADMKDAYVPIQIDQIDSRKRTSPSSDASKKAFQEKDVSSDTDQMNIEDSDSYEPPDGSPQNDVNEANDGSSLDSDPSYNPLRTALQQSPQRSMSTVESPANAQLVSSERTETIESPRPNLDDSSVRIKLILYSGTNNSSRPQCYLYLNLIHTSSHISAR